MDDLHSDSLQSVHSGHHSPVTSPVALVAIGHPILNKIPGIPQFSGTEREKDTETEMSNVHVQVI